MKNIAITTADDISTFLTGGTGKGVKYAGKKALTSSTSSPSAAKSSLQKWVESRPTRSGKLNALQTILNAQNLKQK